ncbi:MAG: aspartate/glutamate racemase family protein [Methyloligellaceae bacterium]
MIGLFDSGHGGLTIFRSLLRQFPQTRFVYLGDHANAPYGNRSSEEILDLTRAGVERLFGQGCRLVILACNTATAIACRSLQQNWLPQAGYPGHNILGVVAPMVEAATQTPWAVTAPQYPQKYNTDTIAVFGTRRTVASGVYREEILKRCPRVSVIEQECPELAGAIEAGAAEARLEAMIRADVEAMLERAQGRAPERVILGCTHYPLVEHLFRRHLPPATRILSQPQVVADSLEDYLSRHPAYAGAANTAGAPPALLTTGDPQTVSRTLELFWPEGHLFERAG